MRKRLRSWITVAAVTTVAATPVALGSGVVTQAAASTSKPAAVKVTASTHYLNKHAHINCARSSGFCTEVNNSRQVFGYYVGHDEPSVLYYSNHNGAGFRTRRLRRGTRACALSTPRPHRRRRGRGSDQRCRRPIRRASARVALTGRTDQKW